MAPSRWSCHLYLCVPLLGICLLTTVFGQTTERPTRRVTVPPLILSEPTKIMAFREGESIEMPCVASGEPQPMYKWQFNNKDFDPSGNDGRIAVQPGVGTLIFARPIKRDEGIYQCFAQNQVGTSISVKVDLRQAILEPFQPSPVRNVYPQLGHSSTLRCIPPRSYPKADIFWATISEGERFTPIDLTDRITIDPEGNLHIVQVLVQDYQEGRRYACIVQNKVMRSIQQGEYQIVHPQGVTIQKMAPRILWQSPTHQVMLRGEIWRVKCIFSGSPPPRVDWSRLDAPMPGRSRQESFGQELVIENVQFEDIGRYECQGINEEAQVPIRRSFELTVESAPFWEERPLSRDAAENDDAVFICKAGGVPEPIYFWFLNGIPIEQVPGDPRRILEKNKLTFLNMSKSDAQVIQCNTTNKHGYQFANAYLNVLSEPPIILVPPQVDQKAAEGQTINLTCKVFGSPKPLVVWVKGSEQLTGGRFKVMPDGNLQISDVSLVDAGRYTCTATNKFDSVSMDGTLIVRRKTLIQTQPLDVMVYEGTEAKFTCTATTDPEEVDNLQINWKKDGQIIDYLLAQRVFKNDMDNSLTISGTISLDTGKYTCVASNGLDSDEWAAQLVVQGPPDPPNNVRVKCTNNERKAEVSWQPGKENYAPILNFIIQFNTTFTPDTWIDIASNVSQNERMKVVTLSPWGNYTFRILARNKIGISQPSLHTVDVCKTEPDRPEKNPENVIGEGDEPNNLVIYWTPMPQIEWNSPSLYYIIAWKRNDVPNAVEYNARVDRPEYYHYVVPESQPTYKSYDIYVKAANSRGEAIVPPTSVVGWSGEDAPLVFPNDVTVVDESIRGSFATLTWTQVERTPDTIRGFFRGYRVQFWKTGEEDTIQEQDFILKVPSQYPRPRQRRDLPPVVLVRLIHIPPDSPITLQVRVLNKYFAGPPSTQIFFSTHEGVPGPPTAFTVLARGSTHFELEWDQPIEDNGELIGYNMSYQTITGLNLGRLQYREPIQDPERTRARLTGLQPKTYYRVFLSGTTRSGMGEPIFFDLQTLAVGAPSPPTFDVMDIGDTYVNITWEPSRSDNPGSVFYIQYRPRGFYQWMATPDESLRFFIYISDLDPGTTYQLRVVSKNGASQESAAEWQEFTTGGVAPGRFKLSTAGWFYGIFVALILIILLMVLFILLKRNRDKWWEAKENEIETKVREMQAQDAVEAMGLANQFMAPSGDMGPVEPQNRSWPSDQKQPIDDYEEEDDEDDYDDDEDEFDDGGQVGYKPAPADAYKPPSYSQVGYHPGAAAQPAQPQVVPSAVRPTTPTQPQSQRTLQLQAAPGEQKGDASSFV